MSMFPAWMRQALQTLRGRYLAVTLGSVFFLLACAVIVHVEGRQEAEQSLRHLKLVRGILARFYDVEQLLRHADEHLAIVLFTPSGGDFEAWHNHMEKALGMTDALKRDLPSAYQALAIQIGALSEDLKALEEEGRRLYALRRDVKRALPGIAFLDDIMYQANLAFKGAAQIAMDALEGDPRYPLAAEVRILWGNIAFNFAVYALNRQLDPAALQEERLAQIRMLKEQILKRLAALEKGDDLPLEVEGAIETMREAMGRCEAGFKEVSRLRTLEDWRHDVAYFRRQVQPLVERVHGHINAINAHLADMLSQDLEHLSRAVSMAGVLLWSIALLAIFLALGGFFYIERTLLHPIEVLAQALRGFPEREVALPSTRIRELRALIEAFSLMAWIVHRRYRELKEEAERDPLTGLLNRRAFFEHLERLTRSSGEAYIAFALLMIDLNGFKAVNDTYGHATGDALLKEVGRRLMASLRDIDVPARYGGDEFVVLLPLTHEVEVQGVCRRIAAIIARPYEIEGRRLEIGASIGVAFFPRHGQDVKTLLRRVDAAMYEAKRAGGGCRVAA